MELGLKDKVAIVAAASKGLGKAVALGLAFEGAKVSICARHADDLQRAAEDIRTASGAEVLAVQADVTRPEDIQRFVAETITHFGRVDILVNNAGGPPTATFMEIPDETWLAGVNLNLMSTIRLTREVVPHMQKQKWGRIINITSIAVKQPLEGLIISNAVRAGILGLAKSLANELGKDNILVNNVCPGYTLTQRLDELLESTARQEGLPKEEIVRSLERKIPLGRLGRPEELANLVVFLASERASYITGTTIQVDGGAVKGIL